MKVLNQLFLVIGNGYEWHEDGYLHAGDFDLKRSDDLENRYFNLPDGFFEKHLYEVEVYASNLKFFEEDLKDVFHYYLTPSF